MGRDHGKARDERAPAPAAARSRPRDHALAPARSTRGDKGSRDGLPSAPVGRRPSRAHPGHAARSHHASARPRLAGAATDADGTDAAQHATATSLARAASDGGNSGWSSVADERLYRLLVQGIKDYAIFLVDPQGRVATWNEGARRLKLYEPEEIIGRHLSVFYPPERRARAAAFLEEARRDGSAEDEGWRLRKDGTRFWADAVLTAVRDESGRLLGFAKVTRDLTARREAETALQRERDNFLAVFRNSPAGMSIMRLDDGTFLEVNEAFASLFGYEREDLLGRSSPEVGMDIDPEVRRQLYEEVKAGQDVRDFEITARRKDGSRVQALVGAARFDFGGRPCMLVMAYDLTQRIQAEAMRVQAARQRSEIERLNELNRFRAMFANTAAHEMLTPLTPIRAMMRVVVNHPAVAQDETLRGHVKLLSRNVDRLMTLVQDLLDVSRLEAGRLTLAPRDIDLAALARDVIDSFATEASAAGLDLACAVPDRVPMHGDPDRLCQVLYNLVSNAVKFTPRGGKVRVEVSDTPEHVTIRIADTGRGLRPESIAQLFQPFGRITAEPGQERPGTGLGLFVCKGIVDLHGGRIHVASPGPGMGSTFTVTLPRGASVRGPSAGTRPAPAA